QAMVRLNISNKPLADLPFTGGAVGLFGYDLGRRFETLPEQALQDIGVPDMAVGIYDWALIVDHQRQVVTLLCHGDIHARLRWLQEQTSPTTAPFALTSGWQSNMNRAQYGEKFRQVQAYLQSGDCYQVNLAQRFQAR
ncbi:aminodeoxychorismate synthase component I, partial [Enterobacter kobei]|nr:aminodeoxychorismate synthase component I [Enterobacter kobei]